jgi:hypothetical protein
VCVVRDVLSNEQAAHLVVNHAPSPSPHDNHPHEALEVSTEASVYRHSETCRHRHRDIDIDIDTEISIPPVSGSPPETWHAYAMPLIVVYVVLSVCV